MTPEELEAIRARHRGGAQEYWTHGGIALVATCEGCVDTCPDHTPPCDAARLVAEVERLRGVGGAVTEHQKVYVLRVGAYSDMRVVGVYATPESAMARIPAPQPCEYSPPKGRHECGWHKRRGGRTQLPGLWAMECAWEIAEIEEYELGVAP